MQISLRIPDPKTGHKASIGHEIGGDTVIDLNLSFDELQWLRQYEPVAWTELMAGLARVGFVVASMKADI